MCDVDGGASTCVDIDSDNANCGGCGVVCAYTCAQGQCGPAAIATGQGLVSASSSLAVDATNVYWNGEEAVFACPLSGCSGTPLVLANTRNTGWLTQNIAVSGANVYWVGPYVIQTCPVSGCSGRVPISYTPVMTNMSGTIAVDTTNVYWSEIGSGNIRACPLDALAPCTPTTIASNPNNPNNSTALTVDAANVYFADNDGWIYVHPLTGGNDVQFQSPDGVPRSIVATGGRIYWATGNTAVGGRAIYSAPIGGGAVTEFFSGDRAYGAYALATDGVSIYWTGRQQTGTVERCAAAATCDANEHKIIAYHASPNAIAVDANDVYWTDQSRGQVLKFHK
jgi:hypothetical protein